MIDFYIIYPQLLCEEIKIEHQRELKILWFLIYFSLFTKVYVKISIIDQLIQCWQQYKFDVKNSILSPTYFWKKITMKDLQKKSHLTYVEVTIFFWTIINNDLV